MTTIRIAIAVAALALFSLCLALALRDDPEPPQSHDVRDGIPVELELRLNEEGTAMQVLRVRCDFEVRTTDGRDTAHASCEEADRG